MNSAFQLLYIIHRWDLLAFELFSSRNTFRRFDVLAKLLSSSGNGHIYPLTPCILFLFEFPDILLFTQFLTSAFLMERFIYVVAKKSFKRRRPADVLSNYQSIIKAADEFSFPSGHSSAAFLMVSALVLFYGPIFSVCYIWAALIAFSRLVLGVHFPSDVMVGSLLGSALAYTNFILIS